MPKAATKLTDKEISNAKPREKGYKLYDEGGLYLFIRPSGTKVWRLPYKFNGKSNTYTIGQYGNSADKVRLAGARLKRDEIKALLSQGIEPNLRKKEEKRQQEEVQCNTFKALALEWYSKQTWADKHAKNILSRLEKDVFPVIGFKPIADVSVRDVMRVLDRIIERGALDVAKRINQYCTQIFDYAIVQELCDNNPAAGRSKYIQAYKPKNRDHLQREELADFLVNLDAEDNNSQMKWMVSLLALTFIRPVEIREARWSEIDLDNALWTIPAERMKMSRDHIVPLSQQALAALEKAKELTVDTDLVFEGMKRHKPFSDVALIKAVKRLTDNKATPHGFRHIASTILNEDGYDSAHIEMQLAHVDKNKVRGTYNKALYLEPRRKMMQEWADYLDSMRQNNE